MGTTFKIFISIFVLYPLAIVITVPLWFLSLGRAESFIEDMFFGIETWVDTRG